VVATVDALRTGKSALSENVRDIVDRISPGVAELVSGGKNQEHVVNDAIRANVRVSANHLRHGSRVLEERIGAGQLIVVGAEYSLETGKVDFFDVP
jgi:carbonic anhydrase